MIGAKGQTTNGVELDPGVFCQIHDCLARDPQIGRPRQARLAVDEVARHLARRQLDGFVETAHGLVAQDLDRVGNDAAGVLI